MLEGRHEGRGQERMPPSGEFDIVFEQPIEADGKKVEEEMDIPLEKAEWLLQGNEPEIPLEEVVEITCFEDANTIYQETAQKIQMVYEYLVHAAQVRFQEESAKIDMNGNSDTLKQIMKQALQEEVTRRLAELEEMRVLGFQKIRTKYDNAVKALNEEEGS